MSLARFGVRKPVPVNLLMVSLIIGGLWVSTVIRREFFPEMQPEQASVLLPYPGATPEEVEESLARKVEDAIWDLDEVDELTTSLNEGGGVITVGFREGIGNIDKAVDEVERVVNALTDLPDDAERLQVTEFEPRMPVIMVSVYGDADEGSMKEAIRGIRDDLKTLPGMGEVTIGGVRDYEVRVDVDLLQLLEHGMSLPQVSDAIRRWMSDIPGGSVRNDAGNVSVRTIGVPERAEAIREIIVRADADGQAVRVGDIATVTESFVDTQIQTRFNGRPSVSLTVYKQLGQDIVSMAEMVRAYVRARQGEPFEAQVADRFTGLMRDMKTGEPRKTNRRIAYDLGATSAIPLPSGCRIDDHSDLARFVEGRLDLLLNNAMWGAMLVFGTLLVFLNWRVAFWVGMGLVTALSGTLVIMYVFDVTLNLLTMFGLIVVLGLLVDDAIVVAENIQAKHDRGESSLAAAISGAEAVTWPVVATVLTSIVAFLPLTFVRGSIGDLLGALPMVVACALAMSLVESLLILPCHMGHSLVHRDRAREGRRRSITQRYETFRDGIIHDRIIPAYAWVVTRSLRYRYMFIAFALAILIISFGFVAGGRIGYTFLPKSDSETIIVDIRMPIGTALARTDEIVAAIEAAAFEQDEVNSISAIVGQNANLDTGSVGSSATHIAQMFIELKPVESRQRESSVIIDAIRERTAGHTDGADSVKYSEITGGPGGPGITVKVRSNEDDVRLEVVDEIKHLLAGFAGVQDIADDNTLGQEEMQIRLKPGAAALGFTVTDVATQVRGALFGLEPHVFAARQEDIDVRVRLDERTRRSLMQVESMWIISPSGALVPLTEIADLTDASSYATIKRVDRRRTTTVTASTSTSVNPEDIVGAIDFDALRARYPRVEIALGGRQEQQADAFGSLPLGFGTALILIYVILAWLFGSYTQPLAVMLAIPFGLVGVIWGHWVMDYDMTFLSVIGFVALSGIVVNDSLILVEFFNMQRSAGVPLHEALIEAGRRRLRPIFLTTVTTVLGLLPLMLEESFQAKFLIPMAISISFGLMSATLLILLVLPCMIVVIDDIKRVAHLGWHGRPREDAAGAPAASA